MLRLFLRQADGKFIRDVEIKELPRYLEDEKNFILVDLQNPNPEEVKILNEIFHFHPLAIEDCQIPLDRPKVDDYGDYLFMVIHAERFNIGEEADTSELDIFLGKNYLVAFHLEPVKSIDTVIQRCERDPELLGRGGDFVLHSIIDTLVDNYFPCLDQIDKKIDTIENDIISEEDSPKTLSQIIILRKNVFFLRRIVAPQRDIISRFTMDRFKFISSGVQVYFRDVYDHLVRLIDMLDTDTNTINGVLEGYMLMTSNRMNAIMKILTLVATIMMSLTLITGIYGMNFKFMPEIQWKYGYFGILALMGIIAIGMYTFFKRQRWF